MPDLINVTYKQTGTSTASNALGMREMQARAYEKRNAQYLLIKAPPASGKSRALMFLGLDKVLKQGLKKVVIAVPQKAIGSSFAKTDLKKWGFFANWSVDYDLCFRGNDDSKVNQLIDFLKDSSSHYLLCTHATLRFAWEKIHECWNMAEAFDKVVVAVDEFHHTSAEEGNKLGAFIDDLMKNTSAHIIAMTGSYFRGDAIPVLSQEAESKFEIVNYTYYEQLNGYKYLKTLKIDYQFYTGKYFDTLKKVLDPSKKTIIHIPSVNSSASTGDKRDEVDAIVDILGKVEKKDENNILTIKLKGSDRRIKLADLVHDDEGREQVVEYLKSIQEEKNLAKQKAMMDIIVALGMAKEGFDWVWCEHALTIGYRASLTEIVQIIGRATRDCPGKTEARFTNLIAQPENTDEDVKAAINNMLKAITLSLLMEQVLAPPIHFKIRSSLEDSPSENEPGTTIVIEPGSESISEKVKKLVATGFTSDVIEKVLTSESEVVNRAMANPEQAALFTEEDLPKIITKIRPDLSTEETRALSKIITAELVAKTNPKNLPSSQGNENSQEPAPSGKILVHTGPESSQEENKDNGDDNGDDNDDDKGSGKSRLVSDSRRFAINVQTLNLDLISQVNPFQGAYEIIAKSVTPPLLKTIQNIVVSKRSAVTEAEARALYPALKDFKEKFGKLPSISSNDDYERRLAEVVAFLQVELAKRKQQERMNV